MADAPKGFFATLAASPAASELSKAVSGYATSKAGAIAGKVSGGGEDSPEAGAAQGAADAGSEGKSKVWGGIKGALKKLLPGGSAKRPTNIYEHVIIGAPVDRVFSEWTNYAQFPEFTKGPEQATVNDDGTVSWTAKIFLNRRSWKAKVVEEHENQRIRWTSEGAKGTIDGVVTFTPVGDNATLLAYVLEYRPKGFFEWWGNRWRTVGRRARLDVKHFARHTMMLPADDEQDPEQPVEGEETDQQEPAASDDTDVDHADADDQPQDDDASDDELGGDPEPESEQPEPTGVRRPRPPRAPRRRNSEDGDADGA
jgi:uncharacterized membrane protein